MGKTLITCILLINLGNLQGCSSYSKEFKINYELYISPEKEGYDAIYNSVKNQSDSANNSRFIEELEQDNMFCTLEESRGIGLLQCAALIPYYGDGYCDDVVGSIKKNLTNFNTLEVDVNTYRTCINGTYAKNENGVYTDYMIRFYGFYSETFIDWTSFVNSIIHFKYKGTCLLPTDRAVDGSRCGRRAATVRKGGI